jgi:hypothetical protein
MGEYEAREARILPGRRRKKTAFWRINSEVSYVQNRLLEADRVPMEQPAKNH